MSQWPNFTDSELNCSCCGASNPNPEFVALMDKVQLLRSRLNFPLPVTSGYRCPNHEIESAKNSPGPHCRAAVDVQVAFYRAYDVIREATKMGFYRIGISQTDDPNSRFIHLEIGTEQGRTVWGY